MATCWHCESFSEDGVVNCTFCGATVYGSRATWVKALEALPAPTGEPPNFGQLYLAWEIVLATAGLLYWPWWAALGAVFIGLFVAIPATMVTIVLAQQAARLWLAARSRLLRPPPRAGLFALEEQTKRRLREDQEAFDTLVGIMVRERRHRDLMPEARIIEYRKKKVLPAFGQMVRLSVSALLEIELRLLLNQCEEICDGSMDCEYQELDLRYERLAAMQRDLETIKNRWSGYIQSRLAVPEHGVTAEPTADGFEPQLPADTPLLAPEDLARWRRAQDTLRQLRHVLHQTQELRLLKAAKPLARQEINFQVGASPISNMSTLLRQIQTSDRLSELEREYQRIVAERRIVQETPGYLTAPDSVLYADVPTAPPGEDFKNRIDAPNILSNSLPRH